MSVQSIRDRVADSDVHNHPNAVPRFAGSAANNQLSKADRDRLVVENLPLARRIAARFRGRGPDYEDLVQVASAALVGAAARYDPSRCADFAGFAIPTVTGEIKRYFRDNTWAVRVPRRMQELHLRLRDAATVLGQQLTRAPSPSDLAAYLDIPIQDVRDGLEAGQVYSASSLDEPRSTRSDTPPELPSRNRDEFDVVEWRSALRPALRSLSERDRQIIYLRFFQELTQEKIARRVGLSQMQVSRILQRVLGQLRLALSDDRPAA